jgi:hypothetical protein
MNLIKRKTAAEAAKLKAKRNHELVLAMLEMNESEHFVLVVDKASDYLTKQLGPDEKGRERLLGAPEFWAWWRNHWARRDAQFIDECVGSHDDSIADLRAYYKHIHSSDRLQTIRPHKRMMDKSFVKATAMIGGHNG